MDSIKRCEEDCENCSKPYGEIPSSWGCRLPTCKEHKTQKCMLPYWVGDGVNVPAHKIYLCVKRMDSLNQTRDEEREKC